VSQRMPTRTITDDELLRLPKDGNKYELVDGEIRLSPAGGRHGEISLALGSEIRAFVKPRRLGKVFDSSTGFRMLSRNVRSPDVSFVAADRLPGGKAPVGFFEIRPDLAVEVLSPSDPTGEILQRILEYFAGGTRLMWIIDPEARRATIYHSPTAVREVDATGSLDGEDVIPGFHCVLADLLE
jgi:Uma2 family endonuclease